MAQDIPVTIAMEFMNDAMVEAVHDAAVLFLQGKERCNIVGIKPIEALNISSCLELPAILSEGLRCATEIAVISGAVIGIGFGQGYISVPTSIYGMRRHFEIFVIVVASPDSILGAGIPESACPRDLDRGYLTRELKSELAKLHNSDRNSAFLRNLSGSVLKALGKIRYNNQEELIFSRMH